MTSTQATARPDLADRADIAVIGGTGFYSFLTDPEEVRVETPYGDPSAPIAIGTVAGRPHLPPHPVLRGGGRGAPALR